MKRIVSILCLMSFFTFSCQEEVDLKPLEDEIVTLENLIEKLRNEIKNLQCVIALQHAYTAKKKIVSVTNTTAETINYWLLTFADNTTILLPQPIVESLELKKEAEEYHIALKDGQQFVFNRKEIIYPTGIVLLTQQMSFLRGTEVMFEFRVNPSNAIFNYDVSSSLCDIALDRIGEVKTYSPAVNPPVQYSLIKIEQSTDGNGNLKPGQYRAYIRDRGQTAGYKDAVALVLASKDANGDEMQLSTSAMILERKVFTELPVVVIRTENESVVADKETWIAASMTIDGIGMFDNYEGKIGIRGRGNVTWTYPKKPYAIKLDNKASVLGMPAHKRWVLLANYIDRTLIRNHMAFEIARQTELDWTPRGQFVEVMLNDVHLGNYYLCEQIKLGEERVNITEMSPYDVDEESITGGYIIEMDEYYDEVNKFRSEIKDLPVMFKEPGEDVLQQEQFDYMRDYINTIENMLYNDEEFIEKKAYLSMIDINSFIDWWFVIELTGIIEPAMPRSCFFYKDRNAPLKAGPVWDFDYSSFTDRTEGFFAKEALWYDQLFKDPYFVNMVKVRWNLLKSGFYDVVPLIWEWGQRIAASEDVNFAMWDLRNKPVLNGDENLSHREAHIAMQKNYEARLNWLDENIKNLK